MEIVPFKVQAFGLPFNGVANVAFDTMHSINFHPFFSHGTCCHHGSSFFFFMMWMLQFESPKLIGFALVVIQVASIDLLAKVQIHETLNNM
jgi:hypothetical protein